MDLLEIVVVVVAIAIGAFVKGVTGSGLPQVAIPAMASFLGVEHAVVVMTLPGILSNTFLLWRHRSHLADARDLPTLIATGTLGTIGGTWLLRLLDPRLLSGSLAALIFVLLWMRTARPEFSLRPSLTRYLSAPVGFAAGSLQGATGISGPLLSTYLHGYRFVGPVYVVALVTLFQVFALVQAVTLLGLGMFTAERAFQSLLAVVPMLVTLPVGVSVARRMAPERFDQWVTAVILASALKLAHAAVWP